MARMRRVKDKPAVFPRNRDGGRIESGDKFPSPMAPKDQPGPDKVSDNPMWGWDMNRLDKILTETTNLLMGARAQLQAGNFFVLEDLVRAVREAYSVLVQLMAGPREKAKREAFEKRFDDLFGEARELIQVESSGVEQVDFVKLMAFVDKVDKLRMDLIIEKQMGGLGFAMKNLRGKKDIAAAIESGNPNDDE